MRFSSVTGLPEELCGLLRLKQLLIVSQSLRELPLFFECLTSLELLSFRNCPISHLPSDLGQLRSIKILSLSYLRRLIALPESICQLPALSHLSIDHCRRFAMLPENLFQLPALDTLHIDDLPALISLPNSFGQLPAGQPLGSPPLRSLTIHDCKRLSSLPESIGQFSALQQLRLKFLDRLTALPHSLGFLLAMKELRVVECANLVNLPESVSAMGALTSLILDGCSFSGLPGDIGQLQNLVTVKLFSTSLSHLPDSFGQLGQLKELIIYECYNLFELPASFTNLSSLETLLIYGGSSLIDLPLGFENLPKLRTLELLNCAMQYLPDRFGELPSLEILKVQGTDTYTSEGQEIELDGFCSLRSFPPSFSLLTRLEQLIIDGSPPALSQTPAKAEAEEEGTPHTPLPELPRMPGSIVQAGLGRLSSLVHLHIVNTNLPALPENLGDLRELAVLLLEKCHAMTSLPSSMATLPKLQQIDLKSLPLLTHLPENLGQLKALNELGLDLCKSLQDLPSSFTLLSSLIQLSISYCPKITCLPESLSSFPRLSSLKLNRLSKLRFLPFPFSLPSLIQVSLQNCKALRDLPSDLGSLSCLREVDLDGCTQLKELPQSLVDRMNVITVKGSWGKRWARFDKNLTSIGDMTSSGDQFSRLSDDLLGSILVLAASATTTRFDGHDSEDSNEDILRDAIEKALDEPLPSESACVDTTRDARVVTASSLVSFRHALVCKRWLRVARSVHPAIIVPYDRYFSSQTLGSLLTSSTLGFPNLRHLHLGEFATDVVDHHLVRSVCDGCGSSLTHLTMHLCDRRLATRVQEDEIRSAARNGRAAISPSDVSQIFNSCTRLVSLDLRLADGVPTLPPSISRLQQLTRLSMRSTYSALEHLEIQRSPLAHLPKDFGQLRNLRSLTLSLVEGLRELPESFCELPALTRFSLLYCYDFLKLPENFHQLSRLEAVEISTSTASFPDSFGQVPALQELRLQNWDFSQLPASLCSSQSLRSLTLNNCGSMTALPEDFGQISTLEYLNLEMFGDFKVIPDSIGLLSQLKELNVIDCCELSAFPQSVSAMESLTAIVLDGCDLHELPGDIGQLSNLVSLKLSSDKLVTLPDSFGQLGKLKELVFMECNSLLELPNSFASLSSLEILFIYGGASLVDLPPGFETLPKLRTLYLFNCVFASLPDRFGDLPSLEVLRVGTKATYSRNRLETCSESDYGPDLEGACALHMLPQSLVRLTGLVELVLEGCEMLEELPPGMGGMASLRVLQCLPESLVSLGQLTHFNIYDLPSLQQLIAPSLVNQSSALAQATHDDLSNKSDSDSDMVARLDLLSSLQHLHIALSNLSALPESLADLVQLRVLLLEECPAMTSLPDSLTSLSNLRQLTLKSLPLLTHLPEDIGQLKALRHLSLESCQALNALPPSFTLLSALVRLTIADCNKLTCLSDSISSLSSLASLSLTRLPFLRRLPSPLSLPRLIKLSLQGCKRMRALPCDLGSFPCLREVDLDGCIRLKELPVSLVDRAMLYAVGLGKGAIPAAAAVNWVLKDGLGYAAKVTLSQFGRHFDVSPKRSRLLSDLVENLSASLELLTATFPQYFVQLAAAAGAGFSASSLVQSATRNRFYAGLAGRRNFAEVLARAEAQGMVSKTLGMALGIAIAPHVGTRGPLLWATHALLSATHLFCNYRSYKAVQLRTLNPFRADIVLAEFVTNGRVPGVIEVNSQEPILPPLKSIFSPKATPPPAPGTGSENWIEFGVPLAAVAHTEREAETMAAIFRGEKYLLGRDERTGQMQVVLKEGALPRDFLRAALQAAYLRTLSPHALCPTIHSLAPQARTHVQARAAEFASFGKLEVLHSSYDRMAAGFDGLCEVLRASGWRCDDGLLARPGDWRLLLTVDKGK
ncbi:unnamed protein product [Closterium sp. Yama58-4]|nr:unnamed protein product [Closterium sp. Yama58-4]